MSTAGARHLAESEIWLSARREELPQDAPQEPQTSAATAPLCEVAAAHDGQPVGPWLLALYGLYGDLD